jgi:5'-3' exonuclease
LDKESKIYIIASDTDYLQLLKPNIYIYTLKYKELKESKTYCGDPEKYLFCKILIGDKTDNIKGVFDKCGPKTAERYWDDQEAFQNKLKESEHYANNYNKNKRIISFDEIPREIITDFINDNLNKLK